MSLKQMFYKKFIFGLIALVSSAIVFIGAVNFISGKSLTVPFVKKGPTSSLTGLAGIDGAVVVVKIDDTTLAHPQVGLQSADVVYIEQVEGGLTRLAAVFSTKYPDLVGPVRSARISDIELMAQYGQVAFAYSGAQSKFRPVIEAANLFDIGANKYGPQFYFNDPERVAPYAMMVRLPELLTEAKSRGVTPVIAKNMGWTFGDAPQGLIPIEKAHVSWPASSYDAVWSEKEDRWLLNHNGEINTDSTGFVLGAKTFVIQMVTITDSIYRDKVGGITPFSATVGEGACYLLRNGGYIPCRWSRPTEADGTRFTLLSGEEVTFERGQIWFALTAKEPVFSRVQSQDATNSASK